MAQIFHRATNPLSRASIYGAVFIVAALVYAASLLYRSPYVNERKVIREQPVPFSHKHHVSELGIECRYCHASVETSSFAGMPPLKTCMTCHSQIWNKAPVLEPLREAYRTGEPLKWVRVNAVPDYVYFDHSIHVNKGIACDVCHGPVGDMPLTWRQSTLQMRWCLECHEHPETQVRPRESVYETGWQEPADVKALRRDLVKKYHVKSLMDCYACHR